MKLLFEPVWPWPWIVLAGICTLASVIAAYRSRLANLPPRLKAVLLGLRLFAWALLMFALLEPLVEFTRLDPHAVVLMLLADESRSMGVKDGAGGLSRREALLKTLGDAAHDLEALGKKIDIVKVDFGADALVVDEFRKDSAGEQTAIGAVLDRVPQLVQNKRITAIVMLSDFAQRALPPNDLDPRAAANRLAEQQVRIDTVPFGTSGLGDSSLDLAVEDLIVSPTVFIKNRVIVGGKIRATGAANRELTVRLMIEDRAATRPGQPVAMRPAAPPIKLRPTQNQEPLTVDNLSFIADEPGELKLSLEVQPLDGEAVTVNNEQSTYITVLTGGVSVAYFDREHRFEQKYLRRIDESPDIRLDFKPVRLGTGTGPVPLQEDWFAPGKYDVYIIGSVPARYFGNENLARLTQAVQQGAGLIMTGGTLSFGPGGYAETPVADVLPIIMHRTDRQTGDEVDPALHLPKQLQMLPTTAGLQHFVMRLDSPEKNLDRWKNLPKLDQANRIRKADIKPNAIELAVAPDRPADIPLLVAQDVGRGRSMAFAADTTWLWYMSGPEGQQAHQRFWQQVIMWLAHKDQQGDESVWVKLDTRRVRAGQPIDFTFGARDPEKRPIDDAEFTVEIIGPGDKHAGVTPERTATEHRARFSDTRAAGEYRVRVEARKAGQAIGLPAEARFIVYEHDLELHNPAADFVMMEELTRITGGENVAPEEFGAYLRKLTRQGLNADVTEVRRVSLWDNWQLLALFAATLTCEWFIRKRRGLV